MRQVTVEIVLEEVECAHCHMVFAIPKHLWNQLHQRDQTFYCPLGHSLTYGPSEIERLRVDLREARGQVRELAIRNRGLEAENVKIKKRIYAGICPHCHRHFANVERHMMRKHPQANP